MMKMRSRGFTLIAVIFILVVVLMIAMVTTSLLTSQSSVAVSEQFSLRAFYIAEAGAEYFNKQLAADNDWTTPPAVGTTNFSGGSFTITTSGATQNRITFNSAGSIIAGGTTYTRTVQYTATRVPFGFANQYAIYFGAGTAGGSGTTNISNNVTINGSILTNSNVNLSNNTDINGSAESSGTVSGNTSGVSGSVDSNVSIPSDIPTLDTTAYTSQLTNASTMGASSASWGTTSANGIYYFHGNFSETGNLTTTTGLTIVATGTITVSNNATVGNNINLIAGSTISLSNNATVGGNCTLYSNNVSGSSFLFSNNVIVGLNSPGGGSVMITPGGVSSFSNNDKIYGLIYCGNLSISNNVTVSGNIIAGHVSGISNNSIINLESGLVNFGGITGITGGSVTTFTQWNEVY